MSQHQHKSKREAAEEGGQPTWPEEATPPAEVHVEAGAAGEIQGGGGSQLHFSMGMDEAQKHEWGRLSPEDSSDAAPDAGQATP